MLARAPALCFSRNFLCFRFSGLLKAIKRAMSNVRTIVCCSKYYQNDFRCEAKVPRREALASDNLALIFFSLLRWISQNFHNMWKLSCHHLKAEKIGVTEAVSTLFVILCFLPLSQIWSYQFLLSTGTGEGTNMFNGLENLKKFQRKKRNQSCSKDPHFLRIELRQCLYLSVRKLSNLLLHLSPFYGASLNIF